MAHSRAQWTTTTLNMTQRPVPMSTLIVHATKKWGQKTVLTSTNKRNVDSFTKVSNEQLSMTALLSTSFVAQHQTSGLIKSVQTTNVFSENFASKSTSSTTRSNGILSGEEHSFAISSIPSVKATPEICPSTIQVSLTPASGDNMHLSTSLKGDKSFIGSQEAFKKSAFFEPQKISKEFDSQTAYFSSSYFILAGINSHDTTIRTKGDVKLFTKGSVSLTNLPRTWKTAELKSFPSLSPLTNKETRSAHNTQTLKTEISNASATKENFSGISSISKPTTPAQTTPSDKDNISPFNISRSRGARIVVSSFVESSATYGPPIMHENSPFTSLLETSPVVSSRSRSRLSHTSTMTIFKTPLVQLSVTSLISRFPKTKTEFPALTKSYSFAIDDIRHELSSSTHSSSYSSSEKVPSSYELKGTLRSSKLHTLTTSYVDIPNTGMQSVHSLHSSKENLFMSPPTEENLSPSTTISTKNLVSKKTKTDVNLKLTPQSSPYSSQQRKLILPIVSTISDNDLAQSIVSRHQPFISSSIVHYSKPSRHSSIMSQGEGALSPSLVKSQILHNTSSVAVSTSDNGHISFSSSYSPVTRRSNISHKTSSTRPAVSHRESLAPTSKIEHEIRLPSSKTSFVSSELVVPFSYSPNSHFQVTQSQSSADTGSYLESVSATSKTGHQVRMSSSQTTPLHTEGLSPSSSWPSRPQDQHKKSSSPKESHSQPTIFTSDMKHQKSFWASSHSSVVSTELVSVPSHVTNLSTRSKTTIKESSALFITGHEIRPAASTAESQIRFSSAESLVVTTDQVATYSSLWNHSDISLTERAVVTSTYHKPLPSSKSREHTRFSSLSFAMTRAIVTPASPSRKKSPSQFSRKQSSITRGDSDSTTGHQIRLSSSQSSSASIELGVLSSHSQSSHKTLQKTASVPASVIYKSSRLSSSPVTGHKIRLSSSQSSFASIELVVLSSPSQSSHKTPQKTTSVASSIIYKSSRLSSSTVTGHKIRSSSSQSSSASTELAVLSSPLQSSLQTQQNRASVATSIIYGSLSSSPVTGDHVRLSSSSASAKLVAPSSHTTKSSSQVPQRKPSSVSESQTSGPSVGYTWSTFTKLRTSSAVGVTPTSRAFKSKITVSLFEVFSL